MPCLGQPSIFRIFPIQKICLMQLQIISFVGQENKLITQQNSFVSSSLNQPNESQLPIFFNFQSIPLSNDMLKYFNFCFELATLSKDTPINGIGFLFSVSIFLIQNWGFDCGLQLVLKMQNNLRKQVSGYLLTLHVRNDLLVINARNDIKRRQFQTIYSDNVIVSEYTLFKTCQQFLKAVSKSSKDELIPSDGTAVFNFWVNFLGDETKIPVKLFQMPSSENFEKVKLDTPKIDNAEQKQKIRNKMIDIEFAQRCSFIYQKQIQLDSMQKQLYEQQIHYNNAQIEANKKELGEILGKGAQLIAENQAKLKQNQELELRRKKCTERVQNVTVLSKKNSSWLNTLIDGLITLIVGVLKAVVVASTVTVGVVATGVGAAVLGGLYSAGALTLATAAGPVVVLAGGIACVGLGLKLGWDWLTE